MKKECILEVKNLSFSYGEGTVLDNVSVCVYRGERIVVMGANGAGKSSFFLNLNGVLQPEQGEIRLHGRTIGKKEVRELRRKVGFVFQDADSQIVASNVRAEISFGPMNLGLAKEEVARRVTDAVSYLDLESLQDRAPHYMSGGEKKRVSIADILAMEPEIFIFDEPMAALDPMNAGNVEEILNRLGKEGKTLLIASHDVDFAWRFADRILVFAGGRLIADAAPAEVFAQEEVLKRAHLRRPSMLVVWEALREAGLVPDACPCPVTAGEMADRIEKLQPEKGEREC